MKKDYITIDEDGNMAPIPEEKYIAAIGFHNSSVGRKSKGDFVADSPAAEKLFKDGYLKEYKTKIIHQKPFKPSATRQVTEGFSDKKITKKTTKKKSTKTIEK